MISETSYLAAKMVSATIEQYFVDQLANMTLVSEDQSVLLPQASIIEAAIDVAFWASLRREEGYSPKISIALIPPDRADHPVLLGKRMRFTPLNLVKLSPAVIQPGIHLGIWHEDSNLYIWGTTHGIPEISMVLEVAEPGLLVVKHRRSHGYGKFTNIAVLKGDQVKIIDEKQLQIAGCPDLLASLLGFPLPSVVNESVNILVELAIAMRKHARGGLLLIVPESNRQWQDSMVHPISYPIDPTYSALDLLANARENGNIINDWQSKMLKVIEIIAGFTAIDGATVITKKHELLAFGAKVTRAPDSRSVPNVTIMEPVLGQAPEPLDPTKIGGTRHLAAAQFVYDQRDSMALVASQDGLFTIFVWSESKQIVHAYRIDTLLL
ncbi:hypothetical protein H8S90_17815 [Olivibacter sp. SDN3]|uniref:putative sensor domain DACNV-containing protein n=1 Tax=Olivibacter sp. SDN3 TaxID=2764720 RepID=UPI0016516BAF|nr:hypothetical protein [Olivibacter sp. SDN3]QNL48629.1 hypothetical protein H8S90_17815 [Olivibacter sp. SDN3]